ncbi:glycosyltransferase [Candidatus Bathyarchaeota archaeon]|nr:glycosyltransferase [Candidatus Bathyarchaeota archaeon]
MEIPEKNYPFVSIIVVVLNMADMIGACLSSLISLDYPKDKYEVIVVDGGSTDKTVQICQGFSAKLVVETRKGRGIARNVGIANSHGDIVAFIDADCVASTDWLSVHVENHREMSVGAVGGSVKNPYIGRSTLPAILSHFDNFAEFDEKLPKRTFYHIPTCNASYKRKVLFEVECFDDKLDMYEDFLLSKKIANSGYRVIFEPKAKVLHFGILPTMTLNDYLAKERKMGAAHFRAQISNKFIFGRLPMDKKLVILFSPMIFFSRAARELYKLLRVRRCISDISAIPILVMGSINWALAYVYLSRVSGAELRAGDK